MSAEKQNMTDFTEYPGVIVEKKNIYQFPSLYYKDDKENMRVWTVMVRLVEDGRRVKELDWPLNAEKFFKMHDKYFYTGEHYSDLPKKCVAQVWTETGTQKGKITRHIPTYYDEIKNAGRANQRHAFHTALIRANRMFLDKQRDGGSLSETGQKAAENKRYFPMLASLYGDNLKHVKFPAFIQKKYDGMRCIAYYDENAAPAGEVVLYTRNLKDIRGKTYIREILAPHLAAENAAGGRLYLDGELYKHGLKLQTIVGNARNDTAGEDVQLEYHIYDCFRPDDAKTAKMPYSERKAELEHFYARLTAEERKIIHLVETTKVSNQAQIDEMFKKVVAQGYEGCIFRAAEAPYATNATKKSAATRSKFLLKIKAKSSEEFVIVGYTAGSKGRDKGAVIWICQNKDKTTPEFNVTPNLPIAERKKIYQECAAEDGSGFDQKYKNRLLTVEYEALSEDGIPQRAKGIIIRDYE